MHTYIYIYIYNSCRFIDMFKLKRKEQTLLIEIFVKCCINIEKKIFPNELVKNIETLKILLLKFNLTKLELELDWRDIYNFLELIFGNKGRSAYYIQKACRNYIIGHSSLVVNLLKNFYDERTGMEIFNSFREYFSVNFSSLSRHMQYLYLFLPTGSKYKESSYGEWMHEAMHMWHLMCGDDIWNSRFLNIFASLARNHYEINWLPHLNFIFTQICKSLRIPIGPSFIKTKNLPEKSKALNIGSLVKTGSRLIVSMIRPTHQGKSIYIYIYIY